MEDHNNEYDQDYGYQQPDTNNKSIKGLKIMIVILALILGALSVMYFTNVRQMKAEYAEEKSILTEQLNGLVSDYDNLKVENDTMNVHLQEERGRVDSVLTRLKNERSMSRKVIKDYEKRVATMRVVMESYLFLIDSLNTLNKKLSTENVSYRKRIATAELRADKAEERESELSTKIQKGGVIRARDIALIPLNASDKAITRANRAARLRVDCVLSGNEIAQPGERNVYLRIIGPDGYVLANPTNATFNYEGDMITFSTVRPDVDYQNDDLSVSFFYNGSGITAGKYNVSIYMDGHLIGSNEIMLR